VGVLYLTDPRFLDHDTGPGHPERPARLRAVEEGIASAGVGEALVRVAPRAATRADLEVLHDPALVDAIERLSEAGGGPVDADTVA
jgi:acetoin utilization deacetylase AcuC-like enzyme